MEVPQYVKDNLSFYLELEKTDPDRAGQVIAEISKRWGI
jgi:hypothetical protein